MATSLLAISVDGSNIARLAQFWADVLDRPVNPAPAHAGQDRDRSSARRGCLTMSTQIRSRDGNGSSR